MTRRLKQYWQQLRASHDARVLAGNFFWLTLLQVAGYLFPLITLPYLAHVIGVDGFGKIAFAAAVISWVQTVVDWGFVYTATRDVAQNRNDKAKVSEIFSHVLWARCCLLLLSFGVLLGLIYTLSSLRVYANILLVSFWILPGHILFPDWFFQAIEKMKYIAVLNVVVKLIFTVLVFVFITEAEDYIYQPVFTALGYLVSGMIAMWIILKRWKYRIVKPNFKAIVRALKEGADVFVNNLMPNLYNSFSVMLLGTTSGSFASGVFEGGNKFLTIVHQFQMVFSRVCFPYLSRRVEKHRIFSIVNVGIAVFFACILYVLAPMIVKVMLAPEFAESAIVLRILAISLVFMVLNNTYGINYLIVVHREQVLRNITIVCSILGMLLAYPMVKHYSYVGAALTVLMCRAMIGICVYGYAKRVQRRMALS